MLKQLLAALMLCTATSPWQPYSVSGKPMMLQAFTLERGSWDCTASAAANANGAVIQALQVSLGTTRDALAEFPARATTGPSGGQSYSITAQTAPIRADVKMTATYYVNATVYFTGGTMSIRSYYHCLGAIQ